MKSIVKIIKFREVVMAIEKPVRFVVKGTCLAKLIIIESKEKLEYILLDAVHTLISKT